MTLEECKIGKQVYTITSAHGLCVKGGPIVSMKENKFLGKWVVDFEEGN